MIFFAIILIEIDFQFRTHMQNSTAQEFAPVYSEDRKIEVTLDEGRAQVKLSNWVDGLGWCGQKTLDLDAELLDELHRVVAAARVKLKSAAAELQEDDDILSAKILEFPRIA